MLDHLVAKTGYGKPKEPGVVHEWKARALSAPVLGYSMAVALGGTFAAVGMVHLVHPTRSLPLHVALFTTVAGLVALALGLFWLIYPAKRVALHEDGMMSFIGWHRRLDVLPGQVQSVSGWTDFGQRTPWRVITSSGDIWLAPRYREGYSLASAILAHSPNAKLSRGFWAFAE
jgi:hypothetical protein